MKALCWHGKRDVRVDYIDVPHIIDPKDIVIKVTTTAICGSDLHLYNHFMPMLKKGDVLGHEFMGEVVEVGNEVKKFKLRDKSSGSLYHILWSMFFLSKETFFFM